MAATKTLPDQLVRVCTKRDGAEREGKTIVAEGTPLSRLQAVFDAPDEPVFVGDINDVLAQCDAKDEVAAKLGKLIKGKQKGEKIAIDASDVSYLTKLLTAASN